MKKVLIFALLALLVVSFCIAQQDRTCDINGEGETNEADVSLLQSMILGTMPCAANVIGENTCNVLALQRVVYATLYNRCITDLNTSSVSLMWDYEDKLSIAGGGYRVYGGVQSRTYGSPLVVTDPEQTFYTVEGLPEGLSWFFAVTAFNEQMNESGQSNEVDTFLPETTLFPINSLTVESMNGKRGTTVSVPIVLGINPPEETLPAAIQFSLIVPTVMARNAEVNYGQATINAGKFIVYAKQTSGLNTVIKCLIFGDINTVNNGVLAFLQIPIPPTAKGSFNIGVSSALAATPIGNPIVISTRYSRITIIL